MGIQLRKDSLDLGIVMRNKERSLAFHCGAGTTIVVDNVELRPGLMVSMVEDPDGNWVEFIDPGN